MLRTTIEQAPLAAQAATAGPSDDDLSVRLPPAEALRLVAMANHPSYGARIR